MPLWGNKDNVSNIPLQSTSYVSKPANSNTRIQLFGNTTANVYGTGIIKGVFAVDTNEQQAFAGGQKPTHAGWVMRTVGMGGRAGRVTYETLVAMGSMSQDSEDTTFVDFRIVIDTQPANSTLGTSNSVNFRVVARTIPAGATLTYRWEAAPGPAGNVFANVPNTGLYASANGNTTATLSISNNATLNLNVYRVLIQTAGANNLYSANAVLTVVG